MPKRIDVPVGARFGRLTVVGEAEPAIAPRGDMVRKMVCTCECGSRLTVRLASLRSGNTRSCGCYHSECAIKQGKENATHGCAKPGKSTANYRLWCSIKRRAVAGSDASAHNYLGRGITMYEPWVHSFPLFDAWISENLGSRPKMHSLDRIDNDGNYEPGNLQWALPKAQNNNTRRNVRITFNEETKTLTQWAEEVGLSWSTLRARLVWYHWSVEKALTTPVRRTNHAN